MLDTWVNRRNLGSRTKAHPDTNTRSGYGENPHLNLFSVVNLFSSLLLAHTLISLYVGKVSENPPKHFSKISRLSSLLSFCSFSTCCTHGEREGRWVRSFFLFSWSSHTTYNSLQFHEDEDFIMPTTCLCCSREIEEKKTENQAGNK